MFTGLVEERGSLRSLVQGRLSALLTIKAEVVTEGLRIGDSMAVNGVCLTVTALTGDGFTVDVMTETLKRTNLGRLHQGSQVNLERALRLGDRVGGHLVTGHVDATGTVLSRRETGIAVDLWISLPVGLKPYFIPQGSVALDGVSLTVAELNSNAFRVSLIPHTRGVTTLEACRVGDLVNIEADLLGKYVYRQLRGQHHQEDEGITTGFLAEHGFV